MSINAQFDIFDKSKETAWKIVDARRGQNPSNFFFGPTAGSIDKNLPLDLWEVKNWDKVSTSHQWFWLNFSKSVIHPSNTADWSAARGATYMQLGMQQCRSCRPCSNPANPPAAGTEKCNNVSSSQVTQAVRMMDSCSEKVCGPDIFFQWANQIEMDDDTEILKFFAEQFRSTHIRPGWSVHLFKNDKDIAFTS